MLKAKTKGRKGLAKSDDSFAIDELQKVSPLARAAIAKLKRENQKEPKHLEWRERQLLRFLEALDLTTADLAKACTQKRLSTVAWLTRNLLELSVWIEFCDLSIEHAKRFRDDLIKDLYGLLQAFQRVDACEKEYGKRFLRDLGARIYGPSLPEDIIQTLRQLEEPSDDDADWTNVHQDLAIGAQSIGITELANNFIRAATAAKELGHEEYFKQMNKLLSKFAHSTTLVVYSTRSPEIEGGIDIFGEIAVRIAYASLARILTAVSDLANTQTVHK